MNPLLSDMPLFVEIAKHLSFSKAAEALGLGVSTLSRRIRLLEKKLGTLLFHRDTHSVRLTAAGALLLEHCQYIMNAADDALESVGRTMLTPAGHVRVSMYADVFHESLRGVFGAFTEAWPDIHLSVQFSEDTPDMLSDPYDVVFRIGPLPDSSMIAKKVITISPAVYAAPRLLERYPAPEKPDDLLKMPSIALARFGNIWELRQGKKTSVVRITPQFSFSSVLLVSEFVLGGHGVALLREGLVAPYVRSGQLVRLLPQWSGPEHDLFVLVGEAPPHRVQVLVDYILSHFARMKNPWAVALKGR